jgi:hypothetical protein
MKIILNHNDRIHIEPNEAGGIIIDINEYEE